MDVSSNILICMNLFKRLYLVTFVYVCYILLGATVTLGALFGMYFWQPESDAMVPIFILAGVWGITDGIWQTQSCSKCSLSNDNSSIFYMALGGDDICMTLMERSIYV